MLIRRRLLASLLALTMLLAVSAPTAASFTDVGGTRFASSASYLYELGVAVGDPDGSFYPLRTITRAEAAKLIVSIIGRNDLARSLDSAPAFPDTLGHWANGYIAAARAGGIISGYPDGTFKPQNQVTYAEMAKMLLEAAGQGPVLGMSWPSNYMSAAQARGLFTGIPGYGADSQAIRGDCAMMIAHTVRNVTHAATGKTLSESVFGQASLLELVPATATARIGAAVQLDAIVRDAAGNPLPGIVVGYRVTGPQGGTITQTGQFRATQPGQYMVTASAAGLLKTSMIAVTGDAIGLRASPSSQTISATGRSVGTITVEVVDSWGNRITTNNTAQITMAYASGGNNGAVTFTQTTAVVQAGVAEFEVTSGTRTGRTDTLVFRATGLGEAQASITTAAQAVAGVELSASPSSLQVNATGRAVVTATLVDQSGIALTSSGVSITFGISGPATFTGGTTSSRTVSTSSGKASVEIYSIQGGTGDIRITAASTNLPSATLRIPTYVAGTPVALRADVSDSSITAAQTGTSANRAFLQVEMVDSQGRPANKTLPVSLSLEFDDGLPLSSRGLAVSGTLTLQAGDSRTGNIIVSAASTSAGKAGTHTIRVVPDDSSLDTTWFSVTVEPGPLKSVRLSLTEAIKVSLRNPTTTVYVQLADAAGNSLEQANVEIRCGWQDPGNNNKGKPTINGIYNPPTDATSSEAIRVLTDSSGRAQVRLSAQPYISDDYRLVFRSGTLSATSPTVTVVDALAESTTLSFTAPSGGSISRVRADADEAALLTVMVRDDNSNPLGNWNVAVEFSGSGENVRNAQVELGTKVSSYSNGKITVRTVNSPGSSDHGKAIISFQGAKSGSYTVTVKPADAASSATVSRSFRTDPGTVIAGVKITTTEGKDPTSLSVKADTPVALRLWSVDAGGNPITAPGAVHVLVDSTHGLYSSNSSGEFRETSVGSRVPQGGHFTIRRGTQYASVYYVQGTAQTGVNIRIRASDAAFVAYQLDLVSGTLNSATPPAALMSYRATDAEGNPIGGVKVVFEATKGSVSAPEGTTSSSGSVGVTWHGGSGGSLIATVKNSLLGSGAAQVEAVGNWPAP